MKTFQNYVVYFSDGRIKIGMTSNLDKRMSYYRQEAKSSGADQVTWWATTAFADKDVSLRMERLMCNSFKHLAFNGLREWIDGDSKVYAAVIRQAEYVRDLFFDGSEEKKEVVGWWAKSGQVGVPA